MSSSNAIAPTTSSIRRPNKTTKARFGNFVDERSYQCDVKSSVINSMDIELLDMAVKSGLKLVIWDFDNCLIRYHAPAPSELRHMIQTGRIENDFFDVGFFVSLVDELTARGVRVAIASFGHFDNIQLYLDAAFGIPEPYFEKLLFYDRKVVNGEEKVIPVETQAYVKPEHNTIFDRKNIVTPSLFSLPDGYLVKNRKQNFLKYLVMEANTKPQHSVFFDDDSKNFEFDDPNEFHIPTCVHTPIGFTRFEWNLGVRSYLSLHNVGIPEKHNSYIESLLKAPRQYPENLRKFQVN